MNKIIIPYIRKKVFFFLALVFIMSAMLPAAQALEVGQSVPNFTLSDMQDMKVSLEDFKGQTVILNFWATWCPPCRGEMPEFNELNQELKKSGEAVLLAINLTDGRRETKAKVAQFLKSNEYDLRVLLDPEFAATEIFSVRGIPTTVVIDSGGVLRGQIVGATTKDDVLKLVRSFK